jgi:hypothetical protein
VNPSSFRKGLPTVDRLPASLMHAVAMTAFPKGFDQSSFAD